MKTVNAFYEEMDKIFNFSLESALIALTNGAALDDYEDGKIEIWAIYIKYEIPFCL